MADTYMQSNDSGLEANLERIEELDLGEAGGTQPTPDTGTVEQEQNEQLDAMVEANFAASQKMRDEAISSGALNQAEAENFQVLETSHKGREIAKDYEETTQNIKNAGENEEELRKLKEHQAEVIIEYAYNTIAMLWKYYVDQVRKNIGEVKRLVEGASAESKQQNSEKVDDIFAGMKKLASNIEAMETNAGKLVPKLVEKYPAMSSFCQEQNADMVKFLDRPNQLDDRPEQSSKELSRFVEELKGLLSLSKMQDAEKEFKDQIERKTSGAIDGTGANETDHSPTALEEGLDTAKTQQVGRQEMTGQPTEAGALDGSATQEVTYADS